MTDKSTTFADIALLISEGQKASTARWEDMKQDIHQRHEENRDRSHALRGKLDEVQGRQALVEGRVGVVEAQLTSIVGDNSGVSGMLNEIKSNVKNLQSDMAIVKQVVQDTPAMNKYIYGVMAVLAFLVVTIPIGLTVFFFIVEVALKVWFKR